MVDRATCRVATTSAGLRDTSVEQIDKSQDAVSVERVRDPAVAFSSVFPGFPRPVPPLEAVRESAEGERESEREKGGELSVVGCQADVLAPGVACVHTRTSTNSAIGHEPT